MGPQKSSTENKNHDNTNPDFNCCVKLNNICSTKNDIKVLHKTCGNEIKSNIFRCHTKSCKFQFHFYPQEKGNKRYNEKNV